MVEEVKLKPCPEEVAYRTKIADETVLAICDAFGKGWDQAFRNLGNPYVPRSVSAAAYDYGICRHNQEAADGTVGRDAYKAMWWQAEEDLKKLRRYLYARDAVLAQCEGALKFYADVLPLVAPSIDTLMAEHALDVIAGLKEKV